MYPHLAHRVALTLSFLAASVLTVAAQTVQAVPHVPQTSARTQNASHATGVIKITGCLKLEKDVAGLRPSAVERAGIDEDYMLISVLPATDSKVSGIGIGPMYELEGIEESQLKTHVNQQVEVEGTVGKPDSDVDVPDFHASSLKMVSPTCTGM